MIAICTLQENNKIQKGQKSRFNPAGLNGVQSKELDWKYIRQVSSDALAAHLCRGNKHINSLNHTTSVNQVLRVMGLDSHDRPLFAGKIYFTDQYAFFEGPGNCRVLKAVVCFQCLLSKINCLVD